MVIVDAHCHVSESWYEPVEVLLAQMERNGVGHAVLIQMQGQFNNGYQTECLRRYPGRFASVVLVDPAAPDAPETLERFVEDGASGLRLNATTRSPGDDPFLIWREAGRHGLAVSCAGAASDFAAPDFAALVEALPGLTIVLEHLGSLNRPDRAEHERKSPAAARGAVPGRAAWRNSSRTGPPSGAPMVTRAPSRSRTTRPTTRPYQSMLRSRSETRRATRAMCIPSS
jgi:predicted TIM-barrel fold metal-dependent hydrolase